MLARKDIFSTPSIDAAAFMPQKAIGFSEFYKIKFRMHQL